MGILDSTGYRTAISLGIVIVCLLIVFNFSSILEKKTPIQPVKTITGNVASNIPETKKTSEKQTENNQASLKSSFFFNLFVIALFIIIIMVLVVFSVILTTVIYHSIKK